VLSLPATRTVVENEETVQICATLVNSPAFAVLGNPIAVNFTTSDGTGKIKYSSVHELDLSRYWTNK
jgi:hypothetical protein